MEVTINYNGQTLSVEVTVEVYEYLDRANHKEENLAHAGDGKLPPPDLPPQGVLLTGRL